MNSPFLTALLMKKSEKPGWTNERVELLRQLWARGLTASQIAAEIGGISRNSVIGKVHRLKLPGRPRMAPNQVFAEKRPRKRSEAPKIRLEKPWLPEQPPITGDIPTQTTGISMETRPNTACTIMELAEGKCRWPLWGWKERPGDYCGEKTIDGHSYCGGHCLMAYQGMPSFHGARYMPGPRKRHAA